MFSILQKPSNLCAHCYLGGLKSVVLKGFCFCVVVRKFGATTTFGAQRRLVPSKMNIKELNEKLSIISRVVVHLKYRTVGLGIKMVRETLHLVGTPYVEMPTVMAKYNPFAEKARMQKSPIKSVRLPNADENTPVFKFE
jgi:hypothetical protein